MGNSGEEIEEAQQEQQKLLQDQIDQQNAEIEQKRQSVFNERINIIRSQGAPTWTPGRVSSSTVGSPTLSKDQQMQNTAHDLLKTPILSREKSK